jgi:hypothetical protein
MRARKTCVNLFLALAKAELPPISSYFLCDSYFKRLPRLFTGHVARLQLKDEVVRLILFDFVSEASSNIPLNPEKGIHRELILDDLIEEICLFEDLFML